MPKLNYFFPIKIFASRNEQTIIFNFYENISDYTDKVAFVNNDINVTAKCYMNSIYELVCSAIFEKEGKYFIVINDIYYEYYIYVVNNSNIDEIDDSSDSESEKNSNGKGEINDGSDSSEDKNIINYNDNDDYNKFINKSKILLFLYLLFLI